MKKDERKAIVHALWQMGHQAGIGNDALDAICGRLSVALNEDDYCPRCHLPMRAPSHVDNGKWEGILCAKCAERLDPMGWYLESADRGDDGD